jgi:broad specificity phosphatase PhoE
MKHAFYLALLLLFTINISAQENNNSNEEISTFYFIRHAEKDRKDKTNHNPHLTEVGHARANHWSEILKHVKFDAIYSTDYNRTKETALPTAKANNLKLTIYDGKNLDGEKLKVDNKGKTVLIVGHSNTTPAFVNNVIGKDKYHDIDDSNNGNLYIVRIINNVMTDQVLEINPQ